MTRDEFIAKAIEGGWSGPLAEDYHRASIDERSRLVYKALIDIDAWKAVNEVEHWPEQSMTGVGEDGRRAIVSVEGWYFHLSEFIEAIVEGAPPEDYLKAL